MLGIDKGNIIIVQEPYASQMREAIRNAERDARAHYEDLKAKGYFDKFVVQDMPFNVVEVVKSSGFMGRTRDLLGKMTLHVR